MTAGRVTGTAPPPVTRRRRRPADGRGVAAKGDGPFGWLFTAPALLGLVVFLVIPIAVTVWVSFRDWNGLVSPFDTESVGLDNYRALLIEDGVRRTDFAISLRNNLWYVLSVVPLQTTLAFVLATVLNQKLLRGKGFFRTAYYFPSLTSSIAVTLIFVFLFRIDGVVNAIFPFPDINWLADANGVIHNALGVIGIEEAPTWMANAEILGLSLWEWIAGPSVALVALIMLVTWTTTGTMMLIFLAGLQGIPESVEEAAIVDGASPVQRFRYVTVPMMKPTLFFVVTLGIIGTWQVFDQIYASTFGGPRKTTLTPAFLIYFQTFQNSRASLAAAIAVLLFGIIMAFTIVNRRIVGHRGEGR